MNKDRAAQIDRIVREASQLLDESVRPVQAACSEKASGVFRSAIGRAMGEMAAGLLFPLWREHPDLEPKGLRDPGSYNARDFEMPEPAAEQALGTLVRARDLMTAVGSLIDSEPDLAQRQEYRSELETVLAAIDAAASGVRKRKRSA